MLYAFQGVTVWERSRLCSLVPYIGSSISSSTPEPSVMLLYQPLQGYIEQQKLHVVSAQASLDRWRHDSGLERYQALVRHAAAPAGLHRQHCHCQSDGSILHQEEAPFGHYQHTCKCFVQGQLLHGLFVCLSQQKLTLHCEYCVHLIFVGCSRQMTQLPGSSHSKASAHRVLSVHASARANKGMQCCCVVLCFVHVCGDTMSQFFR